MKKLVIDIARALLITAFAYFIVDLLIRFMAPTMALRMF